MRWVQLRYNDHNGDVRLAIICYDRHIEDCFGMIEYREMGTEDDPTESFRMILHAEMCLGEKRTQAGIQAGVPAAKHTGVLAFASDGIFRLLFGQKFHRRTHHPYCSFSFLPFLHPIRSLPRVRSLSQLPVCRISLGFRPLAVGSWPAAGYVNRLLAIGAGTHIKIMVTK